MIDHMNTTMRTIVTIEDPIEFRNRKPRYSIGTKADSRLDTASFTQALAAASSPDPDKPS